MAEEREPQGGTTESTERIPPGSMSPEDRPDGTSDEAAGSDANDPDRRVSELPDDADDDEKADKDSKDSFPASDPPAW